MLNKSLNKAILDVLSQSYYGLYDIQFKIMSSDGKFTYTPIHVEQLKITQDFLHGYGDKITVSFPIALVDYANLYDNYNKLTAQLIIKFLDRDGFPVNTKPLLIQKYYPVIEGLVDPRKTTNDISVLTTVDGIISVTLVDPTLYTIRHQAIQGIFHKTSMAGLMSHIAEGYKISTTYITTPDNDHVYDHVVIPPYKEFSDVFHSLQERYGIYMMGINNYYTRDKLYVYSPLDTNPKSPKVARILKADQGQYSGLPSFHKEFDKGISIVINNEPHSSDHSLIASEHHGTSVQFLRNAPAIDSMVHQDDNGIRTFNEDNVITVRLNEGRLGREETNKTIYAHQTDNMFAVASELVRHQYVEMDLQWNQAQPFSLEPGQAVMYYSDESGKVGKRTGQVQAVSYLLKRGDRSSVNTYQSIAHVKCRLSPNEQLSNVVT